MKKSRLIKIIQEEVTRVVKEYGAEQMYFSPSGYEQINVPKEKRVQRFTNHERWKVIAMQLGAVIKDRGDDWIATLPDNKVLGTFSKMLQTGTLTFYN